MYAAQGALSDAERCRRSVFGLHQQSSRVVENIPNDASEGLLTFAFNVVGPVVSFRLVYDRVTGQKKGCGFCEYETQEKALVAIRNLDGFKYHNYGRPLRVSNTAGEKSKEEWKNLQASLRGPPVQNPSFLAAGNTSGFASASPLAAQHLNQAIAEAATAMRGDKKEAALKRQVLKLTDQQIAMFPADQRRKIMILKEQQHRSHHI